MSGFKHFILRGNVLDLAIAVVMGAAFGNVVSAFVKDLLTPLIGVVGGQPNFSALSFSMNHSRFMIGEFLNSVISFLIISATIYFAVVLPINRLFSKPNADTSHTTRKCPECLSDVPLLARKCAFCTSALPT